MYSWQIFPGVKLSDSGPYAVHKSGTSLKYHRLPQCGNDAAALVQANFHPLRGKGVGHRASCSGCMCFVGKHCSTQLWEQRGEHTQACFPKVLPRDPLGEGWSGQDTWGPETGEKRYYDNMFVFTCFPGVEEGNFPLQEKRALSYWELLLLIGMQKSVL